jgi:NADH dehydrogenase
LVIGGTGMLGKPVVEQLIRDGRSVRLLARSPLKAKALFGETVEIVAGDYEDMPSLLLATQGCAGVHISIKGGPKAVDFERADHLGVQQIAKAAKQNGVPRVSLISAYAVSKEKADTPESIAKLRGEAALKESGLPTTILRCSWVMESLPLFVQGSSISLIGSQKHPLHWVAADDLARMVARCFADDATLNKELSIYGPEAWTMEQAMEVYRDLAAPGMKISKYSCRMLGLMGAVTFNEEWKGMATLMEHYERWGEDGSSEEANRLLGAPKITLRQWCERHRG